MSDIRETAVAEEQAIRCPVYPLPPRELCDPAEVAPLAEYLRANTPVQENIAFPRGTVTTDGRLDLCKQNLGPEGCRIVTEALAANTTVRSLLLGTDAIGDEGAADVARLVERHGRLEIVYLGCNRIGPEGAGLLADALTPNTTVTGLWLKRNPFGPEGYRAIATMLRTNRTLRVLDLVNTGPDDASLSALLDVLIQENRTLERLYLGGNGLGAKAAVQLGELLRTNPVLNSLMLSVGHLGDEGALTLANALRTNRTLTELSLASNGISPRGGIPLLEAALSHPTLSALDMGYSPSSRVLGASPNTLGDAGAETAARLLPENHVLARLDLRRNGITERGKASLITALAENQTLRELQLDGKEDSRLAALLNRNTAVVSITPSEDVALIKSVYRTKKPS
jgi:Ran GTPase-activating protein (RanGAP) involved in mRNA processing and transport